MKALTSYAVIDLKGLNVSNVKLIWSCTTQNSLLRKRVIDNIIMRCKRDVFESLLAEFPADFTQQVALKLIQQTPAVTCNAFQAMLPDYLEAEDEA